MKRIVNLSIILFVFFMILLTNNSQIHAIQINKYNSHILNVMTNHLNQYDLEIDIYIEQQKKILLAELSKEIYDQKVSLEKEKTQEITNYAYQKLDENKSTVNQLKKEYRKVLKENGLFNDHKHSIKNIEDLLVNYLVDDIQ